MSISTFVMIQLLLLQGTIREYKNLKCKHFNVRCLILSRTFQAVNDNVHFFLLAGYRTRIDDPRVLMFLALR